MNALEAALERMEKRPRLLPTEPSAKDLLPPESFRALRESRWILGSRVGWSMWEEACDCGAVFGTTRGNIRRCPKCRSKAGRK